MNLSPAVSRAAVAILYAVIVYIVCYVLALLLGEFISQSAGDLLMKFAVVIAILAGIVKYFSGSRPL